MNVQSPESESEPEAVELSSAIARFGQPIIAIAGPVGADTSKVAKALAGAFPRSGSAAFVEPLRQIQRMAGLPDTYRTLQDIGLQLIGQRGWSSFCFETLRRTPVVADRIVLDGLRHVEPLQMLKSSGRPSNFIIIYVDVKSANQREHLLKKGVLEHAVEGVIEHPVERESRLLRYLADYRISNVDENLSMLISDIAEHSEARAKAEATEIRDSRVLPENILDEIESDESRFEVFRQIYRLATQCFGSVQPLRAILARSSESSLDLMTQIHSGDAVEGLRDVTRLTARALRGEVRAAEFAELWGESSSIETAKRMHAVDTSEWMLKAQGLTLDDFGRRLKGEYLSGRISLDAWTDKAVMHYSEVSHKGLRTTAGLEEVE